MEEATFVTYTAVVIPGEDGFVCAQIAEVPEAISQGRTLEEARANAQEALAWLRGEGEPVPAPAHATVAPVSVAAR